MVFELHRRLNVKAVPAVSITCVYEVLAKFVGGKLHQVPIAIPKFDIDCDVRLIFVPNPPSNLLAINLLDVANMVRQRSSTNASRKDQQAEANNLERDEDGYRPRNQAVAPITVRLIPAGKNVERGK